MMLKAYIDTHTLTWYITDAANKNTVITSGNASKYNGTLSDILGDIQRAVQENGQYNCEMVYFNSNPRI
jgi:hypothetical protein